jgi:hypothetical protein
MEYKRSVDGGLTWSDPIVEPNSKALFDRNIGRTFMCEKAVKLDNGNIILFYLTCDMITNGVIWEPYFEPYYAFSKDNGVSFTEARPLFDKRGRIYDVLYKDGTLYILFFANPELPGKAHSEEYDLELYISSDNGNTFEFRSKLPFDTMINCYYGTMEFTKTGTLIAYTYCDKDEFHLKYVISTDNGITWSENRFAFFKKKLRNPQLIRYNDLFSFMVEVEIRKNFTDPLCCILLQMALTGMTDNIYAMLRQDWARIPTIC